MCDFDRSPPFAITIVVPVYNRADQLARLLESLGKSAGVDSMFTVAVCDDGSTESLASVVQRAEEAHGLHIVKLAQPQRGAAAARNLGLRFVSSELTAFTDSDCEVACDWVEKMVSAFKDPDVAIVGGPIMPHPDSPLVARCANWIMSSVWGAGARDPRAFVSMNYYPRAGNMAVRTSVALACGGFPETRHGEDVGFAHNVFHAGGNARFVDDAVVYHNEQRSLGQLFLEAFRKGRARRRLWRTRGAMECVHAVPAVFVAYFSILIVLSLSCPNILIYAGLPCIIYGLLLPLIGLQAVCAIGNVAALPVAPCCAMLMHTGYGIGLLVPAIAGREGDTSNGAPIIEANSDNLASRSVPLCTPSSPE